MSQFGDKTGKLWSPQDEARLKRVRLLSRLLEEQFRIQCTALLHVHLASQRTS